MRARPEVVKVIEVGVVVERAMRWGSMYFKIWIAEV